MQRLLVLQHAHAREEAEELLFLQEEFFLEGALRPVGPLADVLGAAEAEMRLKTFAGKPAPELDAERWLSLPGGLKLGELQGKVVLLDFWGQWCGACVEKLAQVEELHTRLKDHGFVEIGVHTPDRTDNLDEFPQAKKVSFPVLFDFGKMVEPYQVKAWPTYVLFDRSS